ncbi:hypothetical protein HMPREF3189_01094 [Clostridiales bacterium KA00134]|nr:hypothetical protein HMPREF3189_01094 [Clostridiales bacterium KA00134]
MKLLITIVQDFDSDYLIEKLTEENFRVTKLSSSGGFLKSGNTTIFSGVDDERLEDYLQIVRKNCKTRELTKTIQTSGMPGQMFSSSLMSMPIQIQVGGATVFILDIYDFRRY